MMGITQKVARHFSSAVRARGQAYFSKGRVSLMSGKPNDVVARVRGTARYRVRARLRGARLLASCSCPYFGPQGEPCKHLWATLLLAEHRNLLESAPETPIRLVSEAPRQPAAAQAQTQSQGQSSQARTRGARGRDRDRDRDRDRPSPTNGSDYGRDVIIGAPKSPPPPSSQPGRSRRDRDRSGGKERYPGGARGRGRQAGADGSQPVDGPREARSARGKGRTATARSGGARESRASGRNARRLLVYVLDVAASLANNQIVIDLARRQRKQSGEWGPLRPWWYAPAATHVKYDPEDRLLLALLDEAHHGAAALAGARTSSNGSTRSRGRSSRQRGSSKSAAAAARGTRRFFLRKDQAGLVERLAKSGRLRLKRSDGEAEPPTMRWDDGQPWRFSLDIREEPGGKRWTWRGVLRRGDNRMDLAEPLILLPGLLILGVGRAARFDDLGIMDWIRELRREKELTFIGSDQDIELARLLEETRVPPTELVESMDFEEITAKPRPSLTLRAPIQNWGLAADKLLADLEFDYDGAAISAGRTAPLVVSTEAGVVIRRDPKTESAADVTLYSLGFREAKDVRLAPGTLELPAKLLDEVTKQLVDDGWRVVAEGKLIHPAGEFKLNVSTGIDWFDLDGGIDFGGQRVSLPELFSAADRGETMIELGDGSMGMLPEDWIKKYGILGDLGRAENGGLRFNASQAGLLDALLANQPEIQVDEAFSKVRENLRQFDGIVPLKAPPGFRGELRPYQREGLGWLDYLQRFGFGGILADDMGLGKTIQVLALLQRRRFRRQSKGPSLAVVPRSLVFNWLSEAEKFTPRLRVLDYTGTGRHPLREEFDQYDLIVTTYGTVRTDIAELTEIEFDYVILDEAQAIKNAESQSSKAVRLLKSRNRLAMSGTPIENHLGELWSLLEFLNPGMLGTDTVFKRFASATTVEDEDRALLAKALKPFILRRTKAEVVKDLPEKTEQTLYCDMEAEQQQHYDDLRRHYRDALLNKDAAELNRSRMEVLEALLRLRQAACHPALISDEFASSPSAKLDMLLPSLVEVASEGHKVLVFSQFTTFLAMVRERLDEENLTYEYLDGRTRNRAAKVERFQTDPDCPIFLISLKAGGLGLNLTAADYVYLLDPWWNPAVEAQAIDRSHRIGQTEHVFAYRLICRGTVEEKILDLQQKKRDLADAILNADNRGVISTLSREDLEFLLS